jgi:sulfide:quinone oxidoreductase
MGTPNQTDIQPHQPKADILVIGGGSAGIGVSASLLKRDPTLLLTIVEPSDRHYYQPAWTLAGRGRFDVAKTVRPTSSVIPPSARWIKQAASRIDPDSKRVMLADGSTLEYEQLIVCPGLRLAWERIEGLEDTLGKNGVTSNYSYNHAPYTWSLVQGLKQGKAIFTQPPMPIKCAGAPQKAVYLSCDFWQSSGVLKNIEVEFHNAGGVLFSVATFVPPLMEYIKRYHVNLQLNSTLTRVDGTKKVATFSVKSADETLTTVQKPFDILHVVPPQVAPDFIRESGLADAAGWCEVNQVTLQHVHYPDIFSLGDACSAPTSKTAAAARKQIVVVADNVIALRASKKLPAQYNGYTSCPLTVEAGKVILAEFGYGGKLLPTFPLEPTKARASAWFLKAKLLPWIYWNGMLKGREWLARCERVIHKAS